jgi:MinD superfamily P-loop ATPase
LPEPPVKLKDKLASGIVNAAFYKFIIGDKKFYTTDKCVGCGKCAESCVLNNITLENGRPVWHGHCTHCMACICGCPTEAIEYGKHSVGLRRYYLK